MEIADKCAACLNELIDSSAMHCTCCKEQYHLLCLNLSQNEYNAFTDDFITKWTCDMCRSKGRKGGDKTNTPVRGVSSPQLEFVTQRTKPRPGPSVSALTASDIREIIRDELNFFKQQINPQLVEVANAVSTLQATISFFNSELEAMKASQAAQASRLQNMQEENTSLRSAVQSLSARLEQMDQNSRSANIEIQCVPEHKQENLVNMVQQLGKVIKCPVSDTHIQYCTRLAKMNSSSSRPRSILVKLSSPRLRDDFLAAASKFNKNNPDDKLKSSHLGIGGDKKAVFVGEHLTPALKSLHAAARTKAKELKYKFVWIRDGRIFMRKNEESNFIHVKNLDLLHNLS